jgi:hypothetical protein
VSPEQQQADLEARTIFETVWRTRTDLARDPRERGRSARLLVLVGHELWARLRKRDEVDDGTGAWSCRDGLTLLAIDAQVHPVDVPLVDTLDSWRLVRDVVAQ